MQGRLSEACMTTDEVPARLSAYARVTDEGNVTISPAR